MRMLVPEYPYTVYYKVGCPYSEAAVKLLDTNGINYRTVTPGTTKFKAEFGSKATFPRIFDGDGELIGGYDDLSKKLSTKK